MDKYELLRRLQVAAEQFEALLEEIDPMQMDQPGVNGDWSMKDLIAHHTGWNHRLVDCMRAAQRGQPFPPTPWPVELESEDDINAWIYASNREYSVRDVLEDMRQTHGELVAVIQALPDDVRIEVAEPSFHLLWVGDQRFLADEFFHHFHDEHEADVRAWMARNSGAAY